MRDGQIVGHVFVDGPAGVSGHNATISNPSVAANSPVSGLPTARMSAIFTPAAAGDYTLMFSLNGGNLVQASVKVN